MRALVIAAVVVAAACDLDTPRSAPPAAPPAATTVNRKADDDCRDACEQQAILTQSGDDALRACRAGCDARYGGAVIAPHEAPSRITRAPAVHRPPSTAPIHTPARK